jgi:hypothetical protein
MRVNDRPDSQGQPGVFLEEIQSDRHQEGRKKGYKGQVNEVLSVRSLSRDQAIEIIKKNERGNDTLTGDELLEDLQDTVQSYLDNEDNDGTGETFQFFKKLANIDGVPDAPFRKDWPLQMFKRALADAVAAGKQWIGWTTGETQAERYKLSRQLGRASLLADRGDRYTLFLAFPNGERLFRNENGFGEYGQRSVTAQELESLVGKPLAQNLIEGADKMAQSGRSNRWFDVEGEGLNIGGEGMKGFYDTILPKEIGKYVKQWGAGVQRSTIETFKGQSSDAVSLPGGSPRKTETTPIWRVDITPQMQDAVESGQALFSAPARRTPQAKADNQKALKDMITSMRPIWRDTLQAMMIDGKSIAQFAQERGLPEETVGRILRDATGRLQFLQRSAEKGLRPTVQVQDDKVKASSGRPDLAMSGNAPFAAVDQMRGTPEEVTHAEMQDMAESLFAADPVAAEKLIVRWMDSGTTVLSTDGMPDSIKGIVDAAQARSAAEMLMTAAAKMLVTEKALSGGNSTQIARLIDLYRNTGTEQARALNMRRDPHATPEERAAMYLSEVLLTPPESMRNEMRRNPANKERILAAWAKEAEKIKEQLKAEGYDLDETFAEFRKEQKLAETAIPKEVKIPLAKTTTKTRKLVKAVLEGKTWRDAANAAGMTLDAARAAYNAFRSTINQTGAQAAQQAKDELLRSAPAGDFAAGIGLPEWLEDASPDASPVQTQATEALKKQRERKKKGGEINLANPVAVVRAKRSIEQRKSNTFDKISEFWRASILSGPQTHVVNLVSGLTYGTYEATFKKLAVGAQADVARLFGMNPDAASLADIPAMMAATLPAIKSAFIDSVRAWQTESRLFDAYTRGQKDAMDSGDAFKEAYAPALKGMVGKVMRGISFRAMGAADEFVKSFFTRIEIAAQARQIARSKGLSGKAMADEIAYQLTPGSESWVRALEQAKKITFQTEIGSKSGTIDKLDNLARMISETKKGRYGTWLKGLSHFVFPFVDTPTNIFKAGVTMSPIGSMLALVDATRSLNQRRKGNKEEAQRLYNAARAFDDIVNQTVAWGFILAFSEMVKPGDDEEEVPFITGTIPWRSTSKGEREVAYRTAPPQSIRIGGQWYSYKRLDPFASALAFTVDSLKEFQSGKPIDEVWGQVGLSMMRNMQDKTFLQGVSDLFNAINDPERFATKWATGIATGFIPNLIRQPIRTYDPIIRDSDLANDMPFWENLGRRVGYGVVPQYAPPAFDVWGREASKNTGTGGPMTDFVLRLLSPVDSRDADNVDPLDVAILRYNMQAEKPLGIIAPSREIRREVNGQTVSISLNDAQREEMARKSGQAARLAIGSRFNGKDLTEDDAEAIQAVVQQSQRVYRELAFRQAMQDRK